jgi:magnesium chelatase family protein
MLARVDSATPWGIEARPVEVEVDVQTGLPTIQIVGLPDAAVRESRERVRSALRNCGFDLPPRAVTVNLAPADLRKEGNHLDLAIALALLAAHGALDAATLEGRLVIGELGLDGAVRPVRGALAVADAAQRAGCAQLLLPAANAAEAAALGAVPAHGVASLGDALGHLTGERPLGAAPPDRDWSPSAEPAVDLADVRGQTVAKRALEIAAAGAHNLLLIGPPGAGKTLLARTLPGILPPLDRVEAVAVTKVHSLAADEPPSGLLRVRPFRAPHAGVSAAGLIGGGPLSRPGEVSLAHAGVLFLDELPEFRRDALEALRQPLEDGVVTIARARAAHLFPARFMLVAAMNPCPCGHLGDPRHPCRCPLPLIERYRARVSGPLLDRVDLHVEVPPVRLVDLRAEVAEPSREIAERVARARLTQRARFEPLAPLPANAALEGAALREHCTLDEAGRELAERAFERLGFSARALHRVLKVARTIADLADRSAIEASHVAEAIQYRSLDRRLGQDGSPRLDRRGTA